jgi:hypothetical protein
VEAFVRNCVLRFRFEYVVFCGNVVYECGPKGIHKVMLSRKSNSNRMRYESIVKNTVFQILLERALFFILFFVALRASQGMIGRGASW